MDTIVCKNCGLAIEVSAALSEQLAGQIEAEVLAAAQKKHQAEISQLKADAEAQAKQERAAAAETVRKQLDAEKTFLKEQAEADLELAKKQMELRTGNEQKRAMAAAEAAMQALRDDASTAKADGQKLREQLTELTKSLRSAQSAQENAELEMQKKLSEESAKIRDEALKTASEQQRLNIAAKEKTITDLQKALDEAQRKAAQGSQQLQGEIMELDLEKALDGAFRDDDIAPVPKGVNGADIAHTVRSPRGTDCGLMLWEIKRTKHWTDGWVPKLKEDVRAAKASIAIIVTEALPKDMAEDMGQVAGVWVCKPPLAIVLGTLLRKGLLDVARQKALADNRGDKADALYNFITSHEFVQQVESMVETYTEMTLQVTKERVAFEKLWSQREKQAQKLLLGTANIVGSMQGYIGQASMPRIKGLDLLEAGDDPTDSPSGRAGQGSLL